MKTPNLIWSLLLLGCGWMGRLPAAEIAGTSIIPHTIESPAEALRRGEGEV